MNALTFKSRLESLGDHTNIKIEMNDYWYLVLKSLHNGLVHIKFDRDLRFTGTHVTVGIGVVQRTRYKKLFPGVRLLIQEDLFKKNTTK